MNSGIIPLGIKTTLVLRLKLRLVLQTMGDLIAFALEFLPLSFVVGFELLSARPTFLDQKQKILAG